ncbi:hypothetical protein B0H13DRAFT_2674659 [Mycena leptocephala]|nr:hypothetical protein B0H13DRAFT_2674659 [Mycena leptocephala]
MHAQAPLQTVPTHALLATSSPGRTVTTRESVRGGAGYARGRYWQAFLGFSFKLGRPLLLPIGFMSLPLAFPFKLALWFLGVRVRVRVHSRLPLLLDLPLSLFLFGFLVLWVCVLFVSTSSLVDAGAGGRLGGCEDARKGEVEWKKGCRAETFRKTGKKGCEDAGMQKRSERRASPLRSSPPFPGSPTAIPPHYEILYENPVNPRPGNNLCGVDLDRERAQLTSIWGNDDDHMDEQFLRPAIDRTFSIELTHPSFNHAIAIANNVDPKLDQTTVELPIVPAGDQYTLQFVNITDINQIFATSGDFSIAAAASPSSTVSTASASPTSTSIPAAGSSIPAAMSGIPSASTSIGMVPSPTSPLVPPTAATDSQSAALSGASSAASDTAMPSTANPLAPPLPGVVILLFLAFCTTLLAGAWVL